MPNNLSKKLETIYTEGLRKPGVSTPGGRQVNIQTFKNGAVEYHFKQDQIIDEPINIVLNKHQHIVIEPTTPSQQLKRTIHETYHIDYVGDLAYTIDHKFKTRYNKDL